MADFFIEPQKSAYTFGYVSLLGLVVCFLAILAFIYAAPVRKTCGVTIILSVTISAMVAFSNCSLQPWPTCEISDQKVWGILTAHLFAFMFFSHDPAFREIWRDLVGRKGEIWVTFAIKFRKIIFNFLLFLGSVAVGVIFIELGARGLSSNATMFEWDNYSIERTRMLKVIRSHRYDKSLGWVLKEGYARDKWIPSDLLRRPLQADRFHVGENGFRSNGFGALDPRSSQPIIAVGDSFLGALVNDEEAWPARLEQELGIPVLNGGVGGYGIDQIYMRLKSLLTEHKPRLAIFSFINGDLERSELQIYSGTAKPYFSIQDGQLILKNVPVPVFRPGPRELGWLRQIFGYSHAIDILFLKLGKAAFWRHTFLQQRANDGADGTRIGCLIMKELKRLEKKHNVPIVIFSQYTFRDIQSKPEAQKKVLKCAEDHGLSILDSYKYLYPLYDAAEDKKGFGESFWRMPDDPHHSVKGDRLNARQLSAFIRQFL